MNWFHPDNPQISLPSFWKHFIAANVDLTIPFVDFAPLPSNCTLSTKKGCQRFENKRKSSCFFLVLRCSCSAVFAVVALWELHAVILIACFNSEADSFRLYPWELLFFLRCLPLGCYYLRRRRRRDGFLKRWEISCTLGW